MPSVLAFVLFCTLCTVLAFKRHPIWGLYFYLASIYVHPPSRWWADMLPDLRWAMLSGAVTAIALVMHRDKLQPKPVWLANTPALLLTLYTVWMWIQSPWALAQETHIDACIQFTKYLAAFWFVYRLVDTKQHLCDFLLAHVAGCGLLGIFCYFAGRTDGRLDGVGGPGIDDANTLGMYLATAAVVCAGLILTQRGWRRYFSLAAMAMIANGIVLTNTRGAMMGLLAGMLVLTIGKARKYRPLFWSLAVVAVFATGAIIDETFIKRMQTIGDVTSQDEDADMSARSRVVIYDAQVQMFLDYPLGSGHRGTAALSPRYMDHRWLSASKDGDDSNAARSSHNTFMTTLVEQGVPGAAMFIALVLWLAVASWRVRSWNGPRDDPELTTLAASICGALVVVFVAGIATDFLLAEVQFWMFAAAVCAIQMRQALVSPATQPAPSAALAHGRA